VGPAGTLEPGSAGAAVLEHPSPEPIRAAGWPGLLGRLIRALPRGRTLPEQELRRRHRIILLVLWAHVPILAVYGLLEGHGAVQSLGASAIVAAIALGATVVRHNLRLASVLVAVGLVTCSASFIQLSGGVIEAHFHLFFAVALLALYEDWLPFLIAGACVLLHHGLAGALEPEAVYNHPSGQAHPWRWAGIHGVFVAAVAFVSTLAWRLNESLRDEMVQAHRRQRESDQRFRAAFDGVPHGMALVSLAPGSLGRFLQVNKALAGLTGYPQQRLLEMDFLALTHPDDLEASMQPLRELLTGDNSSIELEKRYIRADGSEVWVQINASAVRDAAGRALYNIAQIQDITQRKRHHSEHELLSAIVSSSEDAILSKTLEGVVTSWNPGAARLYGYSAAEAIGRPVGELIVPEDLAGDEMAVIEQVLAGERVDQYETRRRRKDGRVIDVSVAAAAIRDTSGKIVGISAIGRDITERRRRERELLRDVEDYSWATRIRSALDEDRFVLFAQPVVDLHTGEATRAEVLIRMRGERGADDFVSPGDFLDVAERFGLIGEIDRWVVQSVVPLLKGPRAIELNLSADSIGDPTLTDMIQQLLLQHDVDPAKLTVEITETAAVRDIQSAQMFGERLQRLGCGLALDDFGTGYGTFTYLKHMHVDFIKIDMQFIRDLVHSESDRQVVRSLVGVARDFGVRTIAEGVENRETLELLQRLGVDFAQGYYLGRPERVDAELLPQPAGPAPATGSA
jgi:PAS domain S-box-containing protein